MKNSPESARIAIYFEPTAGGIRMVTTTKADQVIARLGRVARARRASEVMLAFVVDRAQAKKLRRVLQRAWGSQYRGAGVFTILPAEVERVARHLVGTFGLTCYGLKFEPGRPARQAALRFFARGSRSRRRIDNAEVDPAVLDELLAAGIVTRHVKRATGEVIYQGTERAGAVARRAAAEQVPEAGKTPVVEPVSRITDVTVVPDPMMTRGLLVGRMEEAEDAGEDPLEVVHQQAYSVAVVNLREQIGGLAAVTEVDEPMRNGAKQFRLDAERGQLGGTKAIDYSADRVDVSTVNVVADIGAAARAGYEGARQALKRQRASEKTEEPGIQRLAVAERMIVAGQSVREIAAAFGLGASGAARGKITAVARDAARTLAQHYGFLPSRRSPVRFEGDTPTETPDQFRTEIEPGV